MNNSIYSKFWPWFFFAAAFESLTAIIVLLSIPSESGLSTARLGLLSILFAFFVPGIYFGIRPWRRLDSLARSPFILSASLLSLTSGLSLFLLRYLDPERLLPVYVRLSPLLWFLVLFGIQSALFLLLLKNGFHYDEFLKCRPVYASARFAFLILLFVFGFITLTKLGITRDTGYWGEPGVAILGWRTALAIVIGLSFLIYELRITDHESSRLFNFFLPFAIWLTASVFWLTVPWQVLQNSFYAPISLPANIPFPYSDAGFYDYLAQSLLIGTDYLGRIPPRPLYVLFLAVLHWIFGQDYIAMIAAQTLVLAAFPVALYFLGKKLHSVGAGVAVALFAIFRELISLWISSDTRVANSKMFVTDFPTALGIAAVCLVTIRWLEKRDVKSTLLAGGSFGLLLLLRTQSSIILPFLFLLAWFAFQRRTKLWLVSGILFGLVMAAAVAPWLAHNYKVTGRIAFDDPAQMAVIYSQYSFSETLDITKFDFESESLGKRLLAFTLENPGFVAGFVTNHFLATEVGGLLALPLIERFDGLFAPINMYWVAWDGSLEWYNVLLLLVYLSVIALGIGASWQRLRWVGLIPLAFNAGYALANGIARFSSWRYNLPVDWVPYFYFGIGAMEILAGCALLFGAGAESFESQYRETDMRIPDFLRGLQARSILTVAAFALIGALPWLAQGVAEPRFTASRAELIQQVADQSGKADQVREFLSQPETNILEGKLLYPRYYRPGYGLSSTHPWPAFVERDFPRLGFVLLNDTNTQAVFPTREPFDFPHFSDAIVLTCTRADYEEVRLIVFPNTGTMYESAPLTNPCN